MVFDAGQATGDFVFGAGKATGDFVFEAGKATGDFFGKLQGDIARFLESSP